MKKLSFILCHFLCETCNTLSLYSYAHPLGKRCEKCLKMALIEFKDAEG